MSATSGNRILVALLMVSILLQTFSVEAARRNSRSRSRRTFNPKIETVHRKRHRARTQWGSMLPRQRNAREEEVQTLFSVEQDFRNREEMRNYPFKVNRLRRTHHRGDARTEVIKKAILTLPELSELLGPAKWRWNLDVSSSNEIDLQGTVRRKRLYCRVGIGYHLEITSTGKAVANHRSTDDGIMEIFSVKRSVIGIRSVQHKRYLCMNKAGRVFTRTSFRPDCEFRENLEKNNFNTYSSEQYSNHVSRKGYYLAINRSGRLPRRMKKISWRQKRAHWLPRNV